MASSYNLPSANIKLPEKTVAELAHGDVPESYIYKNGAAKGFDDAALPLVGCPTVDLQLLASSSPEEVSKFGEALSTWGCFQLVNHGISNPSLDEMREVIEQFYGLPLEEKQKYASPADDIEGYGSGTFISDKLVLDWTDRMYLTTHPINNRKLHYWPQEPDTFKEKLHHYSLMVEEINQVMLKATAKSLDLEESAFEKEYKDDGMIVARFNMYPPCPLPDRVLGLQVHTDGSFFTLVLQDKQVEGLQVLKDGKWYKVPIIPDALFVNVGDQLEIISNGIYKSLLHRVVTSMEKQRISLAMFCYPNPEEEVGPLEELIKPDRPQMYKRVTKYVQIYVKHFQLGESPLLAVRID